MIRDRVQQTSTTSGVGPLTLDGTVAGYLTMAGAGYVNNDPLQYVVLDGNNWELIEGLFQSAGPSLTRVRTIASSSGSPINFSGGTKQVWADLSSEMVGPMGGRLRHVVTTNVGNAYTATYKPALAALVDGMEGSIRINAANTGATTLVLNALASKNVRKFNGAPVADADWKAGQIVNWKYDATADIIIWTNAPDAAGVKVVSATTYTILAEDIGRLLRFTNGSGCAVTQPQALATNAFASPFYYDVQAVGGTVTVTPTTSQIDAAASASFFVGTGGRVLSDNTNYFTRRDAGAGLPTGYLVGGIMSNDGTDAVNDIDVTAITCRSDDDTQDIKSTVTIVKQFDVAFAEYSVPATASGGRDSSDNLTGAKWFNVYMIWGTGKNPQPFASTSASPTLPSGFTKKRRIGSVFWTGSTIKAFTQNGDDFLWALSVIDVDATNPGSSAVLRTLSVPTGVKVRANISAGHFSATTSAMAVYISSPDQTDDTVVTPGTAALAGAMNAGVPAASTAYWRLSRVDTWTNTSAQVRSRLNATGASDHFGITTFGWTDLRGK